MGSGSSTARLDTLINVDLPWNPARLEQRKGRIDPSGQLAAAIDVLNLRYRGQSTTRCTRRSLCVWSRSAASSA
jgi:hypothetical protein